MIRTNKANLQFILAVILMLSFAVVGCNNPNKETTVTTDTTDIKAPAPVIDTTMEVLPGDSAPRPGGGG